MEDRSGAGSGRPMNQMSRPDAATTDYMRETAEHCIAELGKR